jgi:multidrug efflux system outer membrane protein
LAAFRQHEAAKLDLLPSFALTLDAGRISDGLTSLLRIAPWLIHGTIGMNVPLYMGGALRAKVEIATARQKRVVASYGSALLQAFYEVEVSLTNESSLASQLQKELKAYGDYSDAVRLATIRYQAGAGDLLSVLIMQEKALGSQSKVIQLRNARLANRINLHLALGGGFDEAPATFQ